ncbi:MAG: PIN domain-containing protein [Hyphomicrobiales bacterium]
MDEAFDAFEGRILPIDRAAATTWGEALAQSEKHADDAGLAATAQVSGLIVVTRNTRHFTSRGVPMLDLYKSPPEHFAPRLHRERR